MSSRVDDLLVSAANSLKAGGIPLSHPWLVENEVTFNEAMDVAECMASAIHVYRAALDIALHETRIDAKEDRNLAEIVTSMTLRQAGVMGALVEGARLEGDAQQMAANSGEEDPDDPWNRPEAAERAARA